MAFWFYRGLRRGVVTTRYPKGQLDPWTRNLPTAPAFRADRLTPELAERLAAACPGGAITTDGRELIVDLGRCTACGRCLELAGEAAAPSGEPLLATVERSDLIKRIPVAGR